MLNEPLTIDGDKKTWYLSVKTKKHHANNMAPWKVDFMKVYEKGHFYRQFSVESLLQEWKECV